MCRLAPEHHVMHGLSRWTTLIVVVFNDSHLVFLEHVIPCVVSVLESNPEKDAVPFGYNFILDE